MLVYLAGPLFTSSQRNWNSLLANNLRHLGIEVLVPQEFCQGIEDSKEIAVACWTRVTNCDIIVVNCDGVDSGSSMEVGYAKGLGKLVIAYRTDIRRAGENVNMIDELVDAVIHIPLGGYSEIGRAVVGHIRRLFHEG